MVTLRHFTREDAEPVRAGLYPDMTGADIRAMIDAWNTRVYQGRYFEMFAVLSGQGIVGCASICGRSRSIASLGIEIFAAERGKGFASEALAILSEYVAEKGYRMILDQVRADNAASVRLHEKLGFETDGCVYRNRKGHEVVLYMKPV